MKQGGNLMTRSKGHSQRIARALMVVLLAAQSLLALHGCAFAATSLAMPFTETQMPDDCAGMSKHACLMSYLQSDQAPGSIQADGAVFHPGATVALVAALPIAEVALLAARPSAHWHTGPPPPRILFCRLLR